MRTSTRTQGDTAPALLTVARAAELLGCEQYIVYRLIYERKLPAVRLGSRSWRIVGTDIEAMMAVHGRA